LELRLKKENLEIERDLAVKKLKDIKFKQQVIIQA
jgi:hypothetical protein